MRTADDRPLPATAVHEAGQSTAGAGRDTEVPSRRPERPDMGAHLSTRL